MAGAPMVLAENVHKSFGAVHILRSTNDRGARI